MSIEQVRDSRGRTGLSTHQISPLPPGEFYSGPFNEPEGNQAQWVWEDKSAEGADELDQWHV